MYPVSVNDSVAGSSIWSKFALTAAASRGVPSWNFTPCLIFNVYVSPSGDVVQDAPSQGTTLPSGLGPIVADGALSKSADDGFVKIPQRIRLHQSSNRRDCFAIVPRTVDVCHADSARILLPGLDGDGQPVLGGCHRARRVVGEG